MTRVSDDHGAKDLNQKSTRQQTKMAQQAIYKNNGNGNGNGNNNWQIVIMSAAVLLSLAGAFWSVANPRDDLRQVKSDMQAEFLEIKARLNSYVTEREYRENVLRKDKDTDRLDSGMMRVQAELNERISGLRDQIVDLRKELTGSYNIGKQLDNLQRQVDELRKIKPVPGT